MTEAAKSIPQLYIGSAYYPEHWPEDRWPEDVRLMQEAKLNVARVGEFAWSTFEPSKGKFHFDWMDRAITLLAVNGIQTVMGTPTAAPPAWLFQEHPDHLMVDDEGRNTQFSNHCYYCVNSPEFHAATTRLVAAMAEHFADNPNIIGWQIDNEFSRVCYCDRCKELFQQYLAEKYQTLDDLNTRWSTAYRSQTYSAWEQIPIPIGAHNPSLMLEWKRFVTLSYVKFQKLQIDLLRPHLRPDVWITHNYMGWFDGLDHYSMSADLDMVSWDWYVGTGHNDPYFSNSTHDLTRGFKRKNFWVMETQPLNVNWARTNNPLYKGEGRTMAWQAVAHGADGLLYWQWRPALGGQEQLHGSLVDQSGQPRLFYAEVQRIAEEFEKVSPLLAGSTYQAKAAVLNDYESRWAIQWQKHHKDFDYVAHLEHYYRTLAQANIPVDIISPDQSLKGYKLVVAPSLMLFDEQRFKTIKDFVESGGYLVLTPRTAMKNRDNALLPERQPGQLSNLAGVEVQEYFAANDDLPVKGNWFTGISRTWAEILKIVDEKNTLTVARYGEGTGWFDNQVAISVKAVKSGMIYYVGAYLDDGAQAAFMSKVTQVSGVAKLLDSPIGVTVSRRIRPNKQEVLIVINHTRQEQTLHLANNTYDDHLSGSRFAGFIKLQPYDVAVLTKTI